MNERAGSPAIQTFDLTKTYDGGAVRALDGVTLSVDGGEWVTIAGPSGCGKSTLLHLLAALDEPTSGRIVVQGRDLRTRGDLDRYRRLDIGLVFQLHNLLPNLTALQNIEVAMLGNGLSQREQRRRATALLEEFELAGKARFTPPRLSGGERQRLAIARALANEPGIMLADEPTGSLDSRSADRVLGLFRRIRRERGVTVVMVTHDAHVATAADRVIEMRDGRIVGMEAPVREAVATQRSP
ncbi:MAG TPA: ABC transporter ATP-binding protein [Dehalococcoidia bacterium]|nr:ABC transporter ATP-binding protein [Dehalococcoidia bacterium]